MTKTIFVWNDKRICIRKIPDEWKQQTVEGILDSMRDLLHGEKTDDPRWCIQEGDLKVEEENWALFTAPKEDRTSK